MKDFIYIAVVSVSTRLLQKKTDKAHDKYQTLGIIFINISQIRIGGVILRL